MTVQTHVSVYGVDETGATNGRFGSGTLIGPALVLVHPPLSRRLAESENPKRLRVGIAAGGGDSSIAEVIDGVAVHVATDHGGEPLVALELLHPASAPIAPLFSTGDGTGSATEAVVLYLAGLPDSRDYDEQDQSELPPPAGVSWNPRKPDGTDDFPWCDVWPDGPGCKGRRRRGRR